MTKELRISAALTLPLNFVTSTQAILAKKKSGKSYLASVQAEELLAAGQQIVAIDPTGAWSGLRSSADGKKPGYPIAVFGGDTGDLALEPSSGEVIAEAIATEHFSAVIDLTLMRKGEANHFMAIFLETLYRKNREALHLFIDEADAFAPQKPFGDQARTLGACEDVVRRGRKRGLGCTLITQRPQILNKNVLSQVDMLACLRMNHPKDLAAIREWVEVHADQGQANRMIESLPALPIGTAWFWDPAIDLFQRVEVRKRKTFDSGATPVAGERAAVPKALAAVDLKRLGATIQATIEKAKAADPKVLQARIRELEKQLLAKPAKSIVTVEKPAAPQIVEKQVAPASTIATLKLLGGFAEGITIIATQLNKASQAEAMKLATLPRDRAADPMRPPPQFATPSAFTGTHPAPSRTAPPAIKAPRAPERAAAPSGENELSAAELKILEACAWMEAIGHQHANATAVAFLAGYSKSGHFTNMRGRLRTAGLIDYPGPSLIALTDAGRAAAPAVTQLTSLAALHDAVLSRLDTSQARLLKPLLDSYPNPIASDALAEAAGFSQSGHFTNMRGRLHTMGLVTYPAKSMICAADLLFPQGLA